MPSRNLLAVIAGQSSVVAILMLILVLTIAGAPLLQQKRIVAQRIGADVALMKAEALSDAILADADGRRSLERSSSAFRALHLRRALESRSIGRDANDFAERATQSLRKDPLQPYYEFETIGGAPHLLYAVSDRTNGVLTIDLTLDAERALIGRYFGQTHVSMLALAGVLIGLLMFGGFALRYYLRSLAQLPAEERRAAILDALRSRQDKRRNLLPWLVALCTLLFATDVANVLDTAVGAGYVLAVMLSLSSSRHWHVTATAALGVVLLLVAPMISAYDENWWPLLETHSVSVFAILMTGFFGSAHLRKSQAEALAAAEAARSRSEAEELRAALERAEAAEAAIASSAADLQLAQERFQRAVSGTADALFEFNLQTGEIWHSPRFREMLGYDGEPAADGAHESFIHPDDGALVGKAMGEHLRTGAPYDVEYRLRRKAGDWLWVRARASAECDAQGQPLWLAGSIHDITVERAAREAMVLATVEAEAASRSKSTFLATMSHEIRTPMNGVIGMTGLLLDTQLDRVQRDYAETIRASADSLLTILNDVLDFSKIEAGKIDIETLDLDLRSNVEDVASIMAFQAAAKGIELIVNVRPETPERVIGDPQRIRQCLLNLVGNAIKFTHSGEVVLEVCTVGTQNGRALVHFEVRDTGIGVAQDSLDKLFQPFTQADSSTTRRFGGTGLGLSIVRRLIDLMGGQVGAQSQLGLGSTFWFTLPLEAVVTDESPDARAAETLGRRILLVDDNETNRRVLSSQLSHAGYDVTTAPSGERALAILRTPDQAAFDAVLLDYHMPDMDGAMLGQQIMSARDIAPTRLLLLTSLDRSGDMQRFSDIGFCAYLTKPVRTRELLDCLRRALAHEAEEWSMHSQPIITRGTLIAHEPRRAPYSACVLLVEDNAINQRVARRFLERLGCEVQVVGDGAKAVEAYHRGEYSFILMDMQMPVMDGLEATQRIRELEAASGRKRTPIVALTANAMMGTLERCLEVGMDDYLTKPLDITRLQDSLDRFLSDGKTEAGSTPATAAASAPAAVPMTLDAQTRERIADIAGGDPEFIDELLEAFRASGADAVLEIRAAAHRKDADALAKAAHKLKGAASNLYVNTLATLAQNLETRSRLSEANDWSAEIAAIAAEFEKVSAALTAEYGEAAQRKVG